MTRTQILDAARKAITVDRAATHGLAEDNFAAIAGHWTWWLGSRLSSPLTAYDVAQMLVGFKQARGRGNPGHADNHVDQVGYSALAAEIAATAAPIDTCNHCGLPEPCTASGCPHPRTMRGRVE